MRTKSAVLLQKQLALPARRCFVCERPAAECGRSRRHGLDELLGPIQRIVREYDLCAANKANAMSAVHQTTNVGLIAFYANKALLVELMLTPKPGLVDQRNSGAHHDMHLHTFLASVSAIEPWWSCFVEIGYACAHVPAGDFLSLARVAGIECEKQMFEATGGVNTHKGAIFSLGVLCSTTGRLLAKGIALNRESICSEAARICAGLVDLELSRTREANTGGERSFRRYGMTGARGEAASGFATVRTVALPVYDRLRLSGIGEDVALLQVFLQLLAVNDDTNIVSRGGLAGLKHVRNYSRRLLREGGALTADALKKIAAFDGELIALNLSPGGSADLLAVTWFLAQFP
jgi:triphosphoribosyl-dephospho-CoA synthase